MSCVFAYESCGWYVCTGRVKHVVDLDLTVARTGPCDDGACKAADAPGGQDVGDHASEGITMKHNSCRDAVRQHTQMAGKYLRLRGYPSQIPTSRPFASGSAAPAAAAEADARPGEENARERLWRREGSKSVR